jgi:Zn-finger nucleic acid-binding protein
MKCPLDNTHMIVVEHEKIELDYCTRCSGVWFDSRELDLLVTVLKSQGYTLPQGGLFTPHQAKVAEAKRKCPICRRNMDKVWVGQQPKVLIDSCPNGDGLWFDGGELNEVLCQVPAKGQAGGKDLLSFLESAFPAACQPNTGAQKTK